MGWPCDSCVHKGFVLLHRLHEMQSLGNKGHRNEKKQSRAFCLSFFSCCYDVISQQSQLRGERLLALQLQGVVCHDSGVTMTGAWRNWSHRFHNKEQTAANECKHSGPPFTFPSLNSPGHPVPGMVLPTLASILPFLINFVKKICHFLSQRFSLI